MERLGHHLPTKLSYIGQLICWVWAYTQCDKLSQIEQIIIKIWVQTQCNRIQENFTSCRQESQVDNFHELHLYIADTRKTSSQVTGRHYFRHELATKLSYIPQIICWVWVYTQCNKLSQIEQLTSKVSAPIQCYLIHLVKLHFTEQIEASEVERLGHTYLLISVIFDMSYQAQLHSTTNMLSLSSYTV